MKYFIVCPKLWLIVGAYTQLYPPSHVSNKDLKNYLDHDFSVVSVGFNMSVKLSKIGENSPSQKLPLT